MTLKRKTAASVCAALLVLGVAAGCSKKESSASSSGGNAKSGSDSGSGDGGGNSGAGGIPNLGNLNECIAASSAYLQIVAAPAGLALGASKEEVEEMKKNLQDLKGKVPSELRADMDTVGKAYAEFFDAIEANGITSDEAQKASKKLDSDEVKKAQDNIDAYFKKNCG
ncbi:MAG: hypothetical protein N2037_13735 [Acidimicrobiales bacterium]|nr:hypothetical protein [Acidimicrobiales bacterium]